MIIWLAFSSHRPRKLRATTENPVKWVKTGKTFGRHRKTGIINREWLLFSPLSVDLIDKRVIHSRVVLAVVKRFWTNLSHALALYNIATPISDRAMPTYRVMPSLYHIFVSLFYDSMPTYRVMPFLCHIFVPLFYDLMPTYRVVSSLYHVFVPLFYDLMPTYRVVLTLYHIFVPLFYNLMLTYRLIPSLCHIFVLFSMI